MHACISIQHRGEPDGTLLPRVREARRGFRPPRRRPPPSTSMGQTWASEVETRLPTGTLTFVFSDIEGSTRLFQALGPRTTRCSRRTTASSDCGRGRAVATRSGPRATRRASSSAKLARLSARRWGHSARSPSRPGRRGSPSVCAWASIRARPADSAMTTWAWRFTRRRGSRHRGTVARCCSRLRPRSSCVTPCPTARACTDLGEHRLQGPRTADAHLPARP